MSGQKRNILQEMQMKGKDTLAEYQAAFTPEAIRAETGTAEEVKSETK